MPSSPASPLAIGVGLRDVSIKFRAEAPMTDAADLLRAARLVPVLTIDHESQAVPLAQALVAGGVRTLEVTLRTPAGAGAARAIRDAVPDAVVGMGTATCRADLELAHALGLAFVVSPGTTPELLDAARAIGTLLIPGIATASELMAAMARGFETVKLFPAEPAGGLSLLRALAGPFPRAQFCPTGGIGEDRIGDYLAQPNVVAVGGSWLAPQAEVARGDWSAITERARRVMQRIG